MRSDHRCRLRYKGRYSSYPLCCRCSATTFSKRGLTCSAYQCCSMRVVSSPASCRSIRPAVVLAEWCVVVIKFTWDRTESLQVSDFILPPELLAICLYCDNEN